MLFNSFEFIFAFLPCTLLLYVLCLRRRKTEIGFAVLVSASLFFYGYWNPAYLFLILFSIFFNYYVGKLISRFSGQPSKLVMICGVGINLALLGYFKYANFFVDNINAVFSTSLQLEKIFLPLAISFFTFQQISYLVDVWEGKAREYNLLHYSLFVCFFPQLIAGPIVHHSEMLPQFMRRDALPSWTKNIAVGISIFSIGLFKKTVLADSLSAYVGPVYDSPAAGQLDFFTACGSTLAYTFQLYFDFSGYSDMAIGCARMFGITLPLNFFSPYKANSIVDFWRRWHITLSRFLRDYLYISLGGNRRGKSRRYINLFLTMLLGGLWHGAGWTFVVWGCLHGTYLMINHAWSKLLTVARLDWRESSVYNASCWLLTFLAVVVSWVFFRAPTLEQANSILLAMSGANGVQIPAGIVARLGDVGELLQQAGVGVSYTSGSRFVENFAWIVPAALLAFFAPNLAQIFHRAEPVLYENDAAFKGFRKSKGVCEWTLSGKWAVVTALMFLFGVLTLSQVSEFLYFQF